jgi:hypothetical protein
VVVTSLVVVGETLSAVLAAGLIAVADVWATARGSGDRTNDKSPTSTQAMLGFMGISPSGNRILVSEDAGCFK